MARDSDWKQQVVFPSTLKHLFGTLIGKVKLLKCPAFSFLKNRPALFLKASRLVEYCKGTSFRDLRKGLGDGVSSVLNCSSKEKEKWPKALIL